MKQGCLCFHSSFQFFQDYARDRFGIITIYLRRTKIKRTLRSIANRPTTQKQVAAGKPRFYQVCIELLPLGARWRELCTNLDVCDRKLAKR